MADEINMGNLARLELKPGDRFVLTAPGPLRMETVERIREKWREFVGGIEEKFPLLVLDSEMKLVVINDTKTYEALYTARNTLLFYHEHGGYAPEAVVTAVHRIDAALGLPLTEFKIIPSASDGQGMDESTR